MDEIAKTGRFRTVCAAIAVLAAGSLPATVHADPPLPLLQQVGYLGRWAIDCDAPPEPSNAHITYYDAGNGLVGRQIERGTGKPVLAGAIDGARVISPGRIAITVHGVDTSWQALGGPVFETEVEIDGDRARTVRSVTDRGLVYIEDGRQVATGQPSPTLTRCREPPRS